MESSKPDGRAMIVGPERLEVLDKRQVFRQKLDATVNKLCWLDRKIEDINRVSEARRTVKQRYITNVIYKITGYSKKHIHRNRTSDVMTRPYTLALLSAQIEHARDVRDSYKLIADQASELCDTLIDLKIAATNDKRLFDARRFPPGEYEVEKEAADNERAKELYELKKRRTVEICF